MSVVPTTSNLDAMSEALRAPDAVRTYTVSVIKREAKFVC